MGDYLDGALSPARWEEAVMALDQEQAQAQARAAELREAAAAVEAEATDLDAEREVVGRLQALQALVSGPRSGEDVELLRDALRTTFERVYLAEAEKPGSSSSSPSSGEKLSRRPARSAPS